MKILIGQNHLDTIGGSETYVYSLINELHKRGHNVELACGSNRFGIMSKKIYNEFNIIPNSYSKKHDVCFINHTTTVKKLLDDEVESSNMFQVCHGKIPELEQPYGYPINKYISISEEVKDHLKDKGHDSKVIINGIDTDRFKPTTTNKKIKNIFSLSQSDRFNKFMNKICLKNNWNFKFNNKFTNPRFDIEKMIEESDLVISLGRGAYEAMSCGKNVLVADWRPYQKPLMDGLLTSDNIDEIIKNNCSGRRFMKSFDEKSITEEIKKYNDQNGNWAREYALENLNISKQVDKMMELK